jgi:hypothetical protein
MYICVSGSHSPLVEIPATAAMIVGRKFASKDEALADDVESSGRPALSVLAFLPAKQAKKFHVHSRNVAGVADGRERWVFASASKRKRRSTQSPSVGRGREPSPVQVAGRADSTLTARREMLRPVTRARVVDDVSYAADLTAIRSETLTSAMLWIRRFVRSTKASLSARQLSSSTPTPKWPERSAAAVSTLYSAIRK